MTRVKPKGLGGTPDTPRPKAAGRESNAPGKPGLHPRNAHRAGYDFPALVQACPELGAHVRLAPHGGPTLDFGDPEAVKALNRALLKHHYGVSGWDIPAGYLCPPIPGRADYLHHLADLLAGEGGLPAGRGVRVLDIGTGANLVYPLLGHRIYGWSFLASDIDAGALAAAGRILQANPGLEGAIELRRQADGRRIFEGLVAPGEAFDACLCNPPFHASLREAREGTTRKWRNLGRTGKPSAPLLNFGGRSAELWCPGGEAAFVARMAEESVRMPTLCRWFTALLSKSANLPPVQRALRAAGAAEVRIIPMAQGQKQSRIVAWRFA